MSPQYLDPPMPTLNMQLPAVSCLTPTGPSATSQPSGPPFFPPLYPPHRQSHSSHHSNERDFPHLSITSGTRMPQPYWVTNSNGGGYGHGSTTPTAGPQSTFDPLTRPAMACLGSGARQVEAAVGPSEGLSRPSSYPIHTIPVAPPHGPHYPHNAAAQMLPLMNSGSTSAFSTMSHTISDSGIKHRPGKDMTRK
ncbi:hypothetical protein CPB86DRAFT_180081 [Serendipita vermifera]|nr:hypothetical protein CPB86DRAFT_180081 [Serendipita vermifera]